MAMLEEAALARPRAGAIVARRRPTPVNPQPQRKVGESRREGLKNMVGELVGQMLRVAPDQARILDPAGTCSREARRRGQACKVRRLARLDGTKAAKKDGMVPTCRPDSQAKVVVGPSRALVKWRGKIASDGRSWLTGAVLQAEGRAG